MRLYEIAGQADWPGMSEVLAPDVVMYEADSLPYAGEYRGIDAVIEGLKRIFYQELEMTRLDLEAILADGDRVVSMLTLGGTARTTGKPFTMRLIEAFEINPDGLVASIRPYWWDTHNLVPIFDN